MDPVTPAVDLVALTRALVDIDSTTGREGEAGRWLADYLRELGCSGRSSSAVDDTRFNVIADRRRAARRSCSRPTSIACRRSFRAASRAIGCTAAASCDAKGILAAQVAAADRLRRDGETRVGLLFVVGEERGSDGAQRRERRGARRLPVSDRRRADRQPARPRHARHSAAEAARDGPRRALVVSGARRVGDRQADRRARSSCASIALPGDPVLGRTHYTVGLITGGVAPNVVSPSAEAEVMFRTVSDAARGARARSRRSSARGDRARARSAAGAADDRARLRRRGVSRTRPTFRSCARWGEPLLFGPGSIHVAHTADEFVVDCRADRGGGSLRHAIARELPDLGSGRRARVPSADLTASSTAANCRAGAAHRRVDRIT